MDYIEKLHILRREKGWSVLELGLKCDGLSAGAVRSILYKKRVPLVPSLQKICKALDITLSELFCEADEIVLKKTDAAFALAAAYASLPAEAKTHFSHFVNCLCKK